MYELVILAIHDPRAKMADKIVPGHFSYSLASRAEDRAVRYLSYCPNDIVMLVEL